MPDHCWVDFEALSAELRRGATNESRFDLYGESEGSGMASACRGRQPRQPEGAPVPDLRAVEADCS